MMKFFGIKQAWRQKQYNFPPFSGTIREFIQLFDTYTVKCMYMYTYTYPLHNFVISYVFDEKFELLLCTGANSVTENQLIEFLHFRFFLILF